MATKKRQAEKPAQPSLIKTHSLTPSAVTTLERIAQDASDFIGWTVSGSAIVRALLRYADQQNGEWFKDQLFPLIEQEIQRGTVWGRKK